METRGCVEKKGWYTKVKGWHGKESPTRREKAWHGKKDPVINERLALKGKYLY